MSESSSPGRASQQGDELRNITPFGIAYLIEGHCRRRFDGLAPVPPSTCTIVHTSIPVPNQSTFVHRNPNHIDGTCTTSLAQHLTTRKISPMPNIPQVGIAAGGEAPGTLPENSRGHCREIGGFSATGTDERARHQPDIKTHGYFRAHLTHHDERPAPYCGDVRRNAGVARPPPKAGGIQTD